MVFARFFMRGKEQICGDIKRVRIRKYFLFYLLIQNGDVYTAAKLSCKRIANNLPVRYLFLVIYFGTVIDLFCRLERP